MDTINKECMMEGLVFIVTLGMYGLFLFFLYASDQWGFVSWLHRHVTEGWVAPVFVVVMSNLMLVVTDIKHAAYSYIGSLKG